MRSLRIAYLVVWAGLGACGSTAGKSAGAAGTSGGAAGASAGGAAGASGTGVDASGEHADVPFQAETLAIAATYLSWGRVDDELRWAPTLCRQPLPGIARASNSDDPTTHGQKLYSVFAKNWASYPNGPHDGQAVVKQSWKIEAVADVDGGFKPGALPAPNDDGDHFYPYAKGPDGTIYRAAEPAGLFIMFKLDPATPGTDEGWVYATVSPAGQVTSAGREATCMGCHEISATHERLFGVPKNPAE
jgi:hypothetical protein